MKKVLVFIGMVLISLGAFAQKNDVATPAQIVRNKADYTSFVGISIARNFEISLINGGSYYSVVEADSRIADFCRAYVQGSVLYVDVDEKNLPSEAKKIMSKKGALAPVMKVTVSIPEHADFQQINLDGYAILSSLASFSNSSHLNIAASGNSVIKSLNAKVSDLSVTTSKKANVECEIACNNLKVVCSNGSVVMLKGRAHSVETNSDGSSLITLDAAVKTITVTAGGSSNVVLSGTADKFDIIGRNNGKVDASKFKVKSAWADVNHGEAQLNVDENLKLTLQSGAKVNYEGLPVIDIDKIQNSTVVPLTQKQK